jgi:PncC family amidohydrolase
VTPDVVDKVKDLERLCRLRGWSVATAESCTGGLLSSWITSQPGVSSFFKGSVVSYSRSVKENVLGVSSNLLAVHGEVSQPVARAMAKGAVAHLEVDWAVAITGVAGPSGGSQEKPVGFVCFAVVGPGFEESRFKHFTPAAESAMGAGSTSREDIQRQSALFAFDLLLNAMR